jgi:glycerol uptake facilitator protein
MSNLFGEFFGTMVLIIFGCGVVANVLLKKSKGEGSGWIVITTGWFLAVLMGVFAATATGAPQADINPAVTLAKTMIGVYTVQQAIATMIAQLVGGIAGGVITWLAYLPHWEITEDKGAKLGIFCTGPAVRNAGANLLCETIATTMLIVGIFFIFAKPNGAFPPGVGPYMVGMLIWALGLSLGGPTGYALNPARDLGPRIAHAILPIAGKGDSDWAYSWVPVVGPFIAGFIAFFIGKAIGII